MPYDLSVSVNKAFANLAPKSPLNKLQGKDRTFLVALLIVYNATLTKRSVNGNPFDPLERISKLMTEAEKLAKRLKAEVFHGPNAELIRPFTTGLEPVPLLLMQLSKRLGAALDLLGKPGRKSQNFSNLSLIQASEFVRIKTGQHYDEYLAELFQAIPTANRPLSEDLSGDAIRKKREYTKGRYPVLYADTLERLKAMA